MLRSSRVGRFAAVGAVGFAVDAAILTALVTLGGWGPYPARLASFSTAVTVTWFGNRLWVFSPTGETASEYRRYLLVQIAGAVSNLGLYMALIEFYPALAGMPVIPLAAGAVLGFGVNYTGSYWWVFPKQRAAVMSTHAGAPVDSSYRGRDNLEAMRCAESYNRHLEGMILEHAAGTRFLDFGAGDGLMARKLVATGRDVTCLEPDPDLRGQLRRAGMATVAGLEQLGETAFDTVYSLNVLEHIEDDRRALQHVRDHVRSGGRLVLYVPAFQLLFSAMDRHVGHHRRYRRPKLVSLLEETGFRVVHARYVDSIGFVATLAYKWLGSRSGKLRSGPVAIYDRVVLPVSFWLDRLIRGRVGKNLLVVAEARSDTAHEP